MAKNSDSVSHFFGGANDLDEAVNLTLETPEAELASLEGEIAVDVYQTDTHVIIVSPIAGVLPENIEISANDDTITISGERKSEHTTKGHNSITQEIYWGAFERTVALPVPCLVDKAVASCKHGILTVKVPKASTAKKRKIKVKAAE